MIDENWLDISIYYIRVLTHYDEEFMRTLVVKANSSKEEVEWLAFKTLPNVKKVHCLDEIESGWLSKEIMNYYELSKGK